MIGKNIKSRRIELGLTLCDLADMSKISKSYLSGLECGNLNNPTLSIIKILSKKLQVPICKLIGCEGGNCN